MNLIRYTALFAVLFMVTPIARAATILECEDAQGNKTYQDRCPPGTKPVSEKTYSTGKHDSTPVNISATLYSIPECGGCDDVREFLQARNIPITEKNVEKDIEVQNELREKSGELKVPVVIIGSNIITGYDRNKLLAALSGSGAGTPEENAEEGETGAEQEQTQEE